ncbi:MAG: hypothetical protein ACLQQ4_02405 [Bacteroidia bacterium]
MPTNKDCSQVEDYKHRRCKERKNFDVFGLAIFNTERFLPPVNRRTPPFSNEQITDAVNQERGLVTTWQLFKLYFDIEKGIITKQEARKQILGFGYIEFKPKINIGKPQKLFKEGKIALVELKSIKLTKGQELVAERNGKFTKIIIESMQLDDKHVKECTDGIVGIGLSEKISENTILWTNQ